MADTHIKENIPDDKLNFFVTTDTFNLFFPMKGEHRFRAIGILPKQYYHHTEIDFDEVSRQVEKDTNSVINFYDTQWYSTYRLHHKKVKSFNKGNIFFCGDAAHVHSPAGGQGMNTGLQNAYNLAWKLGLVIQQMAKENLLFTYHEERNPVANNLLKTTDRLFAVMSKNNFPNVLLRMYLMPAIVPSLMKLKMFRRMLFRLVSQTEINYKHSPFSKDKSGRIFGGMRFPYFILQTENGENISVYEYLKQFNSKPFLLVCYKINPDKIKVNDLIRIIPLPQNNTNDKTIARIEFGKKWIALLRPDMYIGFIASEFDEKEFNDYWKKYFN